MSFGAAAARVGADHACPCGSGVTFGGCCGPLLAGAAAPTAERLMRSRYTAFARRDEAHLIRTWHPRTRPDDLDLDPSMQWTGLEVLGSEAPSDPAAESAAVTFRAHWRRGVKARGEAGYETGVLSERSRFVRRAGRWLYLDGD